MTRVALRSAGAPLWWLLACLPWQAGAAARLTEFTDNAPISAADAGDLDAYFAQAPAALRADFALVALEALIDAYHGEAERARYALQRRPAQPDLRRWVRAVDDMVAGLQRLVDGLTTDMPIDVTVLHGGTLYLVIDGQPVLLSGPQPGDDAALERRVMEDFCSRNDCGDMVDRFDAASDVGYGSAPQASPVWRFGDAAGPVCASGDGLEFQFDDTDRLKDKRIACQRIVSELNLLAEALVGQRAHGAAIDWARLAVVPGGDARMQSVVLNAAGDSLSLPLPSLAQSPDVIERVLPWLAARVEGRRYNLVVLHAGRLMDRTIGVAE